MYSKEAHSASNQSTSISTVTVGGLKTTEKRLVNRASWHRRRSCKERLKYVTDISKCIELLTVICIVNGLAKFVRDNNSGGGQRSVKQRLAAYKRPQNYLKVAKLILYLQIQSFLLGKHLLIAPRLLVLMYNLKLAAHVSFSAFFLSVSNQLSEIIGIDS